MTMRGGLTLAAWLWLGSSVAAQEPQLSPSDARSYREWVERGVDEYENGNFEEAMLAFSSAHRLYANARTLRGLGVVSLAKRDYASAVRYLGRSLDNRLRPLDAAMVAEVRKLLTRARSFTGVLHLRLTPPDARIRVDAADAPREQDGSILLNPGLHQLILEAAAHRAATRMIRVGAGTRTELELSLPPELPPSAPLGLRGAGSAWGAPHVSQ